MSKIYLLILTAIVLCCACENEDKTANNKTENEKPGRPLSRELIKGVQLGASHDEWEKNNPLKDRVTTLKWRGKEYEFRYYADKDYETGQIRSLSLNSENSIKLETIADIFSRKYEVVPLDTEIGHLQAEYLFSEQKLIESDYHEKEDSKRYAESVISSTYIFFYDTQDDILIKIKITPESFLNVAVAMNITYQYRKEWILKTQESTESNKRHLELFLYNKRNEEINEIGEF